MISKDKERVTITIPKELNKKLEAYCKRNNMNKSAALTTSLAAMFYLGVETGDAMGKIIKDAIRGKKDGKEK